MTPLFGNTQNNVITGNGGSDTIDGGGGLDTALYAESVSAITLSSSEENASGTWTITLSNGDKDTLVNVERLSFNDSRVALDLDGHAGSTAKVVGRVSGKRRRCKRKFCWNRPSIS